MAPTPRLPALDTEWSPWFPSPPAPSGSTPFQVLLAAADTGLERDSKAQAEQVRSISVERIGRLIGQIPVDLMTHLDNALRLHLAL